MLNEYAQISHQKFLAREREKLRADKRLRDAAADLLAALKKVEPYVSVDDLDMVRAAIAKAERAS